jgi:hypothetical protein
MAPVYFNGVDVTKAYLNGRPVFLSFPGLGFDPDAQAYITAVEEADGQALEAGVRTAINDFVVGCKADGIWNAIKASAILAGARTLNGALVPLVGTAPTNFNFVSGDYNRKTGLRGDRTSKYLNSGRNNNADPQNNAHQSVWVSQAPTSGTATGFIGAEAADPGSSQITCGSSSPHPIEFRHRNGLSPISRGTFAQTGFIGQTRDNAANFVNRLGGVNQTSTAASGAPTAIPVLVFARNSNTSVPGLFSDARLSFYSIGESLNLAQLDTRVTNLTNAINAAIP